MGYYSDYTKAEETIRKIVELPEWVDETFVLFITDEYPLDAFVLSYRGVDIGQWKAERQYKFIGDKLVMTHETVREYKGHVNDEYSYKQGDIIDYIAHDGDIITGIVGYPPLSVEEVKDKGLPMDSYDDSYIVYLLGEGDTHEHVMTNYIIGLNPYVSSQEMKEYYMKLEERLNNTSEIY